MSAQAHIHTHTHTHAQLHRHTKLTIYIGEPQKVLALFPSSKNLAKPKSAVMIKKFFYYLSWEIPSVRHSSTPNLKCLVKISSLQAKAPLYHTSKHPCQLSHYHSWPCCTYKYVCVWGGGGGWWVYLCGRTAEKSGLYKEGRETEYLTLFFFYSFVTLQRASIFVLNWSLFTHVSTSFTQIRSEVQMIYHQCDHCH